MRSILLITTLIFFASLFCQAQDSLTYKESINYAIHLYNKETSNQLPIYSGVVHIGYPGSYDGIAYFESEAWKPGSVVYDNKLYENLSLKYDEYKRELIVRSPDDHAIILFSKRIQQFDIGGYHFVDQKEDKLNGPWETDFYENPFSGTVSLFIQHSKNMQPLVNNPIDKAFLPHTKYFIKKDKHWIEIKSKKTLLRTLADKKVELQQYFRKNKLKFKKERRKTILEIVKYYDSLTAGK